MAELSPLQRRGLEKEIRYSSWTSMDLQILYRER